MSLTAPARTDVTVAVRATYIAFIGAGFVAANWAARIPQIRDGLHLTPGKLGLVLLAIACGSVLALPLAGVIVAHLGTRNSVTVMAGVVAVGMTLAAIGYLIGVAPVAAGLFVFGFGFGGWDVAMNVQGADVERHLGKSIMPRFHAGYSVGTVAGALFGALMVAIGVPVTPHLIVAALATVAAVIWYVRGFLPDAPPPPAEPGQAQNRLAVLLRRWREPRTLLIGVVVLAFAFCEGTGNDWISVSLIDSYGAPAAIGTLGFATFLAAMTGARWVGTGLIDRYGRVLVIRALAVVAVAGLILFVLSPNLPLAFAGALLWGIGASLGFPVGMSAAADESGAAAARVSVVASIGYCAFLGGPPLIGFLGDQFTVLKSLFAVIVLLAVAVPLIGATRPLRADA